MELPEENVTGKVRDDKMRAREYIYIYGRVLSRRRQVARECVSREPQIRADENTSRASRN